MFDSYTRENSTPNKYKYQHKEFQTDLGLELYDFGPRQYDGWTLRTTTPDPHAERYYNWSNYSWEFGDPVRYGDPSGMDPIDKALGFLAAVVDNALGGVTPLREMAAGHITDAKDFNTGQDGGDIFSLIAGVIEADAGAGLAAGGTAATVVTGGLAAEVGVPAAVVGTGLVAHGAMTSVAGGNNFINQKGRVNAEGKTGSYTNKHESGKSYHGKGGEDRANQSAKRVGKENGDPSKKTEWKSSKNNREAFKDEAKRIKKDGGVENPNNYNKVNSPGKKYLEQDKKKIN